MVTNTAKLQEKIMALTNIDGKGGIDILTDSGEFKSTYDILLAISKVWQDMDDTSQAALLELIAGKTRGSVVAALFQNGDVLEDAYKSATEASGSAMRELETYLDSIQGKMDKFTNSVQTMWMNLIESDVIKKFVDLGTTLVNLADKIGVINILFATMATIFMRKSGISDIGDFFSRTVVTADEAKKKLEELKSQYNAINGSNSKENTRKQDRIKAQMQPYQDIVDGAEKAKIAQDNLAKAQNNLTRLQNGLKYAQEYGYSTNSIEIYEKAVDSAKTKVENCKAEVHNIKVANEKLGQSGSIAFKNLKAGAKAFGQQLGASLKQILIMLAISKVIEVVVSIFDELITTEKEVEEKFNDLSSEVSSLESEIDSLNSELETTQDRMAELLAMDSLSFVEEEELNNLKLQNAELERQLELQKLLLQSKKTELKNQAKKVIGLKFEGIKFDKEYALSSEHVISEDKWYSNGVSGYDALDNSLGSYKSQKYISGLYENKYKQALDLYNQGYSFNEETFKVLRGLPGATPASLNTYASKYYDKDDGFKDFLELIDENYKKSKEKEELLEGGINLVLGDMSEVIETGGLSYSMGDDEVNEFLDKYYAYNLRFANIKGTALKSSAISSIFDDTSSNAMKDLKEDLDEIASSEEDRATKEQKAQALIQGALDDTSGKYERLQTFMNTVGISAQEMAKYFVDAAEAPDMKTMEGVLQVFADGEEILKKYKNERDAVLGQDENGENITWNNLFTDGEDGKTADPLKIASILEGADEGVREQFTKIVEEVENGKITIDQAFGRWEMVGIDKMVENLNTEFEDINNEMFADAADEITGLIDTINELQTALESVSSTMDTLATAQKQMNKSGRISVKTALELISSTDQWDKILNVTEDSITLKDNAEEELINTQLASIKVQTQQSAAFAKQKLMAGLAAVGATDLAGAEAYLAGAQSSANEATYDRILVEARLEAQTYNTKMEEKEYAENEQVVQTAESVKAKAIGLVAATIVGLDAAIEAFINASGTEKFGAAKDAWVAAYGDARDAVVNDADSKTTTTKQLFDDWKRKSLNDTLMANIDDYSDFKNFWDYEDTPGDKYDDDSSDSNSEIDWLDHYFTSIENKIKEKEADLENAMFADVDSIDDKNTIIDGIIGLYEDKIPLLEKSINAYKNRATTLFNGFSRDIQNKIRNGSIDINDYGSELAEDIQDYFDAMTNASDLEVELEGIKVTIADFSLQKFDNAVTAFDNEIEEKFQSDQDIIEAEIDYLDEQGKRVSPELYEKLIDIQKEEQEVLEDKKKTLENILATEVSSGRVRVGSEQWYEMVNAINDVDEALIESKNDVESFQNSINDIYWDNFEKLIDQIDAVDSELSNLFDLLSEDDKVVDEFGNWTDEGIASLGLLAQQMENSQAKADEYAKAIKDLNKDYADGKYSLDEYNEKMADLKDSQLSEIKNIEDIKDKMVDLNRVRVDAVKEAIDKEIEALDEKNKKLKESLDLEKEQYDWQKQVSEKEKSIADIQRRINALAGDTSASAIAERRKLQSELADAQQEMDDMWYEHSIDEQGKILDESLENYKENKEDEKEALDEWLEEEEKVIQESFDLFNSNVDVVASVLEAFEKEHGIKLSEAIVNPWNSGIDAMETYRQKLAEMEQEQEDAKQSAEDTADDIVESLDKPQVSAPIVDPNNTTTGSTGQSGVRGVINKLKEWMSKNGGNATSYRDYTVKETDTLFDIAQNELGAASRWQEIYNLNKDVISDPNLIYPGQKIKLPHYAKGTMGAEYDHWAMVDELGPELQLVPDGSGRLSYITRGTSVIPHDLSEKLVDLALDPTKVLENSRPAIGAPHITTNNFDIDLSFGSLVHVDHCDQNTLPDLQKMVRGEFDNMMKTINQKLRRK